MLLTTVLIIVLFAFVVLATIRSAIEGRDPLARDVVLVFSSMPIYLVLAIYATLGGQASGPMAPIVGLLTAVAGILLLLLPVFTIRLVSHLRSVPRWLVRGSFVLLLVTVGTAFVPGLIPKPSATILIIGAFGAIQLLAATYLGLEARLRTGSARIRLILAALATAALASTVLVSGLSVAGVNPGVVDAVTRSAALFAAVCYDIAFLPPRWLKRIWQAVAAYDYSQRLLAAPPSETEADLWARFAHAARDVSAADTALVIEATPGEPGRIVAVTGAAAAAVDATLAAGAIESIAGLVGRRTVRLSAIDSPMLDALASGTEARYGSINTFTTGNDRLVALVRLARFASLFGADDAVLLTSFGMETALLVDRRRILAEQEALAGRLAKTVGALEAVSTAKSDFLASMSHELRTPLNAIIGFSELMDGEPRTDDRVEVPVEWVGHVKRGGQHLLGLINDVLDLAKVEAGRLELAREPVDLESAVAESLAGLRPLADRKALRLEARIEPIIVDADRGRLRQIIYNLLSNAIKFTPEGGAVTVQASRSGELIEVVVSDTGIGIAPADQAAVFEEFRQVGDQAGHEAGTGLGLALTRRLVEAHGGSIHVESTVGVGSRFVFTLPEAGQPGRTRSMSTPESGPKLRVERRAVERSSGTGVLVIEDDLGAVRLLREYLETDGYQVRVAATGISGLAEARRERPAAILLDVLLPGLDGWEVLRQLKADESLREVPVIIVTVIDEREVGLALGAVDYFLKPVDREALLTRLGLYTFTTKVKTAPIRVLVVDDDPAALALVEAALVPEGFTVECVGSGRQAIELGQANRFDLVICDLVMPEVSGFEVVTALKGGGRSTATPILILTGQTLTEADRARLGDQILGVVTKGAEATVGLREWLVRAVPTTRKRTRDAA